MHEIAFQRSLRIPNTFIILIVCLILSNCASHSSAPVAERSRFPLPPKSHVVIPGDTLFSIAWRYGLKYEELAKYNGIKPPYVIRPSQVIRLDTLAATNTKPGSNPKSLDRKTVSISDNKKAEMNGKLNQRQEKRTHRPGVANKTTHQWNTPQWRWPVQGSVLSSFQGNNGLNKGIDLGGKLGEPVLAAASGQVVYAGSGLRGYGRLLIIKHNETFLSAYAHNERLKVKEGDFVKAGQVIADMGSSGTDRVKLHFEIRRDGTPVDPVKYLPRR